MASGKPISGNQPPSWFISHNPNIPPAISNGMEVITSKGEPQRLKIDIRVGVCDLVKINPGHEISRPFNCTVARLTHRGRPYNRVHQLL